MKAYRLSVRLKLGLIVFAGLIALASLAYTQRLVDRLRDREQSVIQLWADAQAQVAQAQQRTTNPYQQELSSLEAYLQAASAGTVGTSVNTAGGTVRALSPDDAARLREAVAWAETMPPTGELNFILNEILEPNPFSIPAIITDSLRQEPLFWRNVDVPESLDGLSASDSARAVQKLKRMRREMDATYEPIPIRIDLSGVEAADGAKLTQYVHYDESSLVKELRWFPYIQLIFVGLFIAVGYVGFSYVRRSEQSNLWVGMAREAAHQLGTPISSLMGWTEILRLPDLDEEQRMEAVEEIDKDVQRLNRVAARFSDIGSMPKLEERDLGPIIEQTADYIRRRAPQRGRRVTIKVDIPHPVVARVNEELFAWVIENLLKNALDAMEEEGEIEITGFDDGEYINIDVRDTGCGIDRREWRNIFRPGFSTKKRGWGLGLSLARRVVEEYHGGAIRLMESVPGEGSTFRVEIPRAS
ncbi:two-component sensor histidine kinase [Longibacter salinarum]|uniref:histidine kinase n=1 Tax=Longibacter salinarum TaxID=1850348 RepID=A0A2A8CZ08_9BACT|nr:HAMP domain-containing sensor histidine kinase [Longibacter salinarum]PEN13925.1 two-component sensor histidine kinase [Longibacter salinarum]